LMKGHWRDATKVHWPLIAAEAAPWHFVEMATLSLKKAHWRDATTMASEIRGALRVLDHQAEDHLEQAKVGCLAVATEGKGQAMTAQGTDEATALPRSRVIEYCERSQ